MENTEILGITQLVALGSLGMIALIVFIFAFVMMYQKRVNNHRIQMTKNEAEHQKQLLQSTITVEEKERERIAKNLHDDIGTHLNVLKLHITKMSRNPADKELIAELLFESKSILENSIQQVRTISKDLMPPVLVNLGFENAISELCRNINNSKSVVATFHSTDNNPILPPSVQLQLYRIVNEVITNTLKHANINELKVSINCQSTYLITIEHDGNGISNSEIDEFRVNGKGIGIKSILSRIQVIEASIDYVVFSPTKAHIEIELAIK